MVWPYLGLLRRYLIANQWRRIDPPQPPPIPAHLQQMAASFMGGKPAGGGNFDLYVHSAPEQPDIELVVPRTIDDVDFRIRMESMLETLCALTRLDQGEVITRIRAIGFDRVQSKIPNNLVLDDSVQLEVAASYIDNIRELLVATAR